MIRTGWILPDFYEVPCRSCSTLNGHIEVVRRYLEALKKKEVKTHEKIIEAYKQERKKFPSLSLDDFAVQKLGWIKLNNEPMNIIFYSDNCDAELTIRRYINIGYYHILLNNSGKQIYVDIPSNKLI